MENYGEAGVPDFLRLMKDYLNGCIAVDHYRKSYFVLMKKRMTVTDDVSRILQQAYGDADDYDAVVKLEYTIDEAQLRERVAQTVSELAALGYELECES